jgi:hypothetical protein
VVREVLTDSPVDLHLVLDRSGSMDTSSSPTRWEAVRTAITAFVSDPLGTDIGIGLQYFPLVGNEASCSVEDHRVPVAPIQLLPSAIPGILGSLGSTTPGGGTPTRPALEGALQYATSWAVNHPDRRTVVLLITDGEPSACSSTVENVSTLAATAFAATPSVPTFVVGVGPSLDNLRAIATAGGGQAILVDDTSGGDPTQRVLDALHAILDANTTVTTMAVTEIITEAVPVPCEWRIPEPPGGASFDKDRLNVTLRPRPSATPQTIGAVSSAADCSGVIDGWHYDDPVTPTRVLACPQTCTTIQALTDAQLDLVLGCQTAPADVR